MKQLSLVWYCHLRGQASFARRLDCLPANKEGVFSHCLALLLTGPGQGDQGYASCVPFAGGVCGCWVCRDAHAL